MDTEARQLLSGETPISPNTESSTVKHKSEKLSDILDKYIPETLTLDQYIDKVKSGLITADTEKYFIILDDAGQATISDSVISRDSTYSSKKIVELLASGDISGLVPIGPQCMTKTLYPENWSGYSNPHTYSLQIPSISDTSLVTVTVSNALPQSSYEEQYQAVQKAQIKRIKQLDGLLELYAYGDVPTIEISLDISIQN